MQSYEFYDTYTRLLITNPILETFKLKVSINNNYNCTTVKHTEDKITIQTSLLQYYKLSFVQPQLKFNT